MSSSITEGSAAHSPKDTRLSTVVGASTESGSERPSGKQREERREREREREREYTAPPGLLAYHETVLERVPLSKVSN